MATVISAVHAVHTFALPLLEGLIIIDCKLNANRFQRLSVFPMHCMHSLAIAVNIYIRIAIAVFGKTIDT